MCLSREPPIMNAYVLPAFHHKRINITTLPSCAALFMISRKCDTPKRHYSISVRFSLKRFVGRNLTTNEYKYVTFSELSFFSL